MQEHLNDKSVSLVIKGSKLTGQMLAKAMRQLLIEMKKQQQKKNAPNIYKGKQTVKQLVHQGVGVETIDIKDSSIKSFERTARKYGIDFALQKDTSESPPKWIVFFKSRDAKALTAAFSEYSAKTLKKTTAKPSILIGIKKMKEVVKNQIIDKVKNKDKGLEL